MTLFSHMLRASVAVAALVFAGCSTPLANGPEQVFDPAQRFPISAQPRMMALQLPYNGQAALDQNAEGQISRFAHEYLSYGSGSIAVASPTNYPAAADLVVNELVENGVPRNQIMVGGVNAPGMSDDIRVTYIRYVAESPACGDWSTNLGYTAGNVSPRNLGCATRRNIAAMVADPRDFIQQDTSGQPDAQRRLTVLDKYRRGEPTPAEKTEDQTAAISGVAKGM